MDPFRIAGYLILVVAAAAGAFFFVTARKRGVPAVLAFAASWSLLSGLIFTALILMHTGTILGRAFMGKGVGGEEVFRYNFRFYSLMLLGATIAVNSIKCIFYSRKLTNADKNSWQNLLWSFLILFAITVPLLSIQRELSIGFSVFSLIALFSLWLCRKQTA